MNEPLFKTKGRVVDVRKQVIPRMYVVTVKGDDALIEFDAHEDLVVYREGTEVEVTISKEKPDYREGTDFVGHGTVASVKESEGKQAILISVGGLLFIIETTRKLGIAPTDKVYVKIAELGE